MDKAEHEAKMRATIATIMENLYFSDDPETVETGLLDVQSAHGFTHLLVEGTLEDPNAADAVKEAVLTLHIAIEWLELAVIEHQRRLLREVHEGANNG